MSDEQITGVSESAEWPKWSDFNAIHGFDDITKGPDIAGWQYLGGRFVAKDSDSWRRYGLAWCCVAVAAAMLLRPRYVIKAESGAELAATHTFAAACELVSKHRPGVKFSEATVSLEDEPREPKLHHLHAGLAGGTKGRGAVSLDIGPNVRVRLDTSREDKTAIVTRIATLWNMHEGIATETLASGAVRKFYDAVEALTAALRTSGDLEARARAATVEAAWEAIAIERTADGKRAHCDCSEAA
jgi:hypothetical protein